MSYSVELAEAARSDIKKLTSKVQERILKKIRWLAENFESLIPQPLNAEFSGLFKLRVGDYRVIYSVEDEAKIITIQRVGHRRDVYQ